MFWLGKLLGTVFGYMIAGPYGAAIGLMLGHYFDISRKNLWVYFLPPKQEHTRDIFFRATFTIMGYVAKADGRVSENEIRLANRIMQNMKLSTVSRQQAIYYFRSGKKGDFDIEQLLAALSDAYSQQRKVLNQFIDIQLQTAYADGFPSRRKEKILEYLCFRLNLNPRDFFQGTYSHEQYYNSGPRYQHQQYQRYQAPPPPPPGPLDLLEKAYLTLGVNKTTNNTDLKKTYRKLMSKHHPDKLVSKGVSEEKIRLATARTQEIKSAYEIICKARGI
jgi:DnaJ like chaperone protein